MYKCKYDIEEEGPKKRKIGTALSWKKTQSLFIVDCCFVYGKLLWVKLSAKTKSLNKDCLKQSFEIICPTFTTGFKFDNYFSIFFFTLTLEFRAHVGGRFGQRSRLVKIDFVFSLVKSQVQVTLCRCPHIFSTCYLWKCRYHACVYWNLSYPLLSILKVIFLESNPLRFIETLNSFIRAFVYCLYMPGLK